MNKIFKKIVNKILKILKIFNEYKYKAFISKNINK